MLKAVRVFWLILSLFFSSGLSTAVEASPIENVRLQQNLSCRMTKPVLETIQQAETNGQLSPTLLLLKARAQKASGRHEDAISSYLDFLRQDPGNLAANFELGTSYAELGKLEKLDELIAAMAPKWSWTIPGAPPCSSSPSNTAWTSRSRLRPSTSWATPTRCWAS